MSNDYGWRSYLGCAPGGKDVLLATRPPRASKIFDGLPPAFIATGALDLFLEEDLDYARRLIRAGVPTELHVYPGGFHAFDAIPRCAGRQRVPSRLRQCIDKSLRNRVVPDATLKAGTVLPHTRGRTRPGWGQWTITSVAGLWRR